MKVFLRTSSIVFFFLLVSHQLILAQCGVTAVIRMTQSGSIDAILNSNSSIVQPGYKIISTNWTCNDITWGSSTNCLMDFTVPPGINKFELTVVAVDTITLDTCISKAAELLTSTSHIEQPMLRASGTGNNIALWGNWVGGDPMMTNWTFSLDPGDGSGVLNSYFANNSYATNGTYFAHFGITSTSGISDVQQKVHVNDGVSNLDGMQNTSIAYHNCDSVRLQVSTTPPFMSGGVATAFGNYPTLWDADYHIANGQQFGGRIKVPGQCLLQLHFLDSSGWDTQYLYPLVTTNECMLPPDTVSGYFWNDTDHDGLWDAGEPPIAGGIVTMYNYQAVSDTSGAYHLLIPHVQSSAWAMAGTGTTYTYPRTGHFGPLKFNTGTNHGGYNIGITSDVCGFSGKVFTDYNNNQVFNSGIDKPIEEATIKAHHKQTGNDYYNSVGTNGVYTITNVPAGDYDLTVSWLPVNGKIITPDTIHITTLSTGGVYLGQDFAVTSSITGGDLSLQFIPATEARPGFDYQVKADVYNIGIDSIKGDLVVNYDPTLTYQSSTPLGGIHDAVNHRVTWHGFYMFPADHQQYIISCSIPSTTAIGTVLHCTGGITPTAGTDANFSNNLATLNQIVIGSFDPNDKLVFPQGSGVSGAVHHGTRLFYRINFQNTGTASALKVIVQDTIDADLDMNTIYFERSSHGADITIDGRIVTWKFSNINLPDSTSNESGSHGYVEYSISPLPGRPNGTAIQNTAAIYFDFNAPVITNTVTNTLQTNITGVTDQEIVLQELELHPNPASDHVEILLHAQADKNTVEVLDVAGRQVAHFIATGDSFTLPVTDLANGLYFIRVNGLLTRPLQVVHKP